MGDVMRVEGDVMWVMWWGWSVMGVEGDGVRMEDKVLAMNVSPRTGILLPPSAQ